MDMSKLSCHATPETPAADPAMSSEADRQSSEAAPEAPPLVPVISSEVDQQSGEAAPEAPPPAPVISIPSAQSPDQITLETPPSLPMRSGVRKGPKIVAALAVLLGLGAVEMFAGPAVNDLLQRVASLAVGFDFRRGEPVQQPTQNVRIADRASTSVPNSSTSPTLTEASPARGDRRDAASAVTQPTLPDSAHGAVRRDSVVRSAAPHEPLPTSAARAPSGRVFGIGDKLKIAFYERVNVEEDKWGRAGSAMQGFQQRPELSGEYDVQEDGTVSLPLLGSFPVANRTAQDLQTALASAFETLTGRKGVANVLSLERPPVYVVGPVKKPGSYKYVPGMTVLHVIALAGGLDRHGLDPWQRVEAVREVEKRRGAVEALVKLIARDVVLKSERDGATAGPSLRLLELVSETEARQLISEQVARRNLIVFAHHTQERALSESVEAAKQEVAMLSNRRAPLEELIQLRQEHVRDVVTFVAKRIMSTTVLVQAQSELSNDEQRQREAIDQYAMARQRVGLLEQDKAKFEAETRSELETEIMATEQQISANERDFASSEGVLDTLTATQVQYKQSSGEAPFSYEIVRQASTGPVALAADEMTTLQPGDLVRIIIRNEGGQSESMQTVQATPAPPFADVGADWPPAATRTEDLSSR
ncbi:MAG: polysaccharide biosynthesis/export family protein [Methylovirgula sp.]